MFLFRCELEHKIHSGHLFDDVFFQYYNIKTMTARPEVKCKI